MRLKRIDGMKWKEVVGLMDGSCHAFALETTQGEMDVVQAVKSHGPEAGAAVAVAYRFMEMYGAPQTAWKAVYIYDRISPNNTRINNLKDMICWAGGQVQARNSKFSVKLNFRSRDKWGGLANVMMGVASADLVHGSTTEIMGAMALRKFLYEGRNDEQEDLQDN